MDTLTHIALGACVGDALLGKKIGKRAMLVGAMANSIPDVDFISSFWLPIDENLLLLEMFKSFTKNDLSIHKKATYENKIEPVQESVPILRKKLHYIDLDYLNSISKEDVEFIKLFGNPTFEGAIR